MKSEKEDKIAVKQFKDFSSHFWVNQKHYHLNKEEFVIFVCGGIEDKKETEELQAYIKRNKKVYKERSESIFDQEQIEYTKVTFGKFSGHTTKEIVETEKRYAGWLYENVTDAKIKGELKILLNKK